MSRQTRWLLAIVGGVAAVVLVAIVASMMLQGPASPSTPGHWSDAQRTSFIESCVQNCRASPGVTADRYPLCDRACSCAADEGQKIVNPDELATVALAVHGGKATPEQTEKIERMKAAGLACFQNAKP